METYKMEKAYVVAVVEICACIRLGRLKLEQITAGYLGDILCGLLGISGCGEVYNQRSALGLRVVVICLRIIGGFIRR